MLISIKTIRDDSVIKIFLVVKLVCFFTIVFSLKI